MQEAQLDANSAAELDAFRRHFHNDRKAFITEFGVEAFDWAQVLYRCADTGRKLVIKDNFYGRAPRGPVEAFFEQLVSQWWARRKQFEPDSREGADPAGRFEAVAAIYGHYLPEVGFDYSIELVPSGIDCCWRTDGRGKITKLPAPEDDQSFRDQTGTFFDLRTGWGALIERHEAEDALVVAEVQAGYLIGARSGVPGTDSSTREDPELEKVFSRWDPRDYDTLEFLAGGVAEGYPFHGERYGEWLGEVDAASVRAGEVELFVLADSSSFLACIEDLCAKRGVAVEWVDPEADIKVAFHKGPLRVQLDFGYPFLRALHTGRSFVRAARDFFGPVLGALEDAGDILEAARTHVEAAGGRLEVEDDGVTMRATGADGAIDGRWNLLTLAGRVDFRGHEGERALLNFMGFDGEGGVFVKRTPSLERCPVCDNPARVGKVVRHMDAMGIDPRALVGVPIGEHLVYYTLDCTRHTSPVEVAAGWSLGDLESAYQDGLPHAVSSLLGSESLGASASEAVVLIGFDVGSLVLESGRVVAALEAAFGEAPNPFAGQAAHGYGFYPDALVVSHVPLEGQALHYARMAALEAVMPHFPGRTAGLDLVRPLDLSLADLGTVECSG